MAIRTPTLAEIYARQGHFSEAIAIYEHLIEAGGDHTKRLDALRKRAHEVAEAARRDAKLERLRGVLRRVQKRARA